MSTTLKGYLITLAVITALVLTAFEIHKTIAIVINKQVYTTTLWGFTVADALKSDMIPVYEGDEITPELDQLIKENQVIEIKRAAWVIIVKNNEENTLWTTERNPISLINAAGINLHPSDILYLNGKRIDLDETLPYMPVTTLKVEPATQVRFEGEDGLISFFTHETTLIDALWDSGIMLFTSDMLTPEPQTSLTGEEIVASLVRSKEITISMGEKIFQTRVLGETVGDALNNAGVSIQGLDYSIPTEEAPIPADCQIRVVKVREEYILEKESIPFGIEYIPSQEIDLDDQQVIQTGEYGILARRVRVVYEDDLEISRAIAETWTAKEPKPRQVGYGTKVNIQTLNTADGPIQYYRAVEAFATSYSPCRIGVSGKCSNRTASGAELKKGVIGVVRSWYNYMKGARVYIPGYGFGTIQDIGAGFSDRHWVDLGYSDDDWVNWSRYVTVYFLLPIPSNILYILN